MRRATLLWLDLRAVAAADPPSPEQRRQLEEYNAEHLGFVRKDPDNSVRRVWIAILLVSLCMCTCCAELFMCLSKRSACACNYSPNNVPTFISTLQLANANTLE